MALYEYVTQEQLSGFDKYKYSAVDTNPLSIYIMHPFWNAMVKTISIVYIITAVVGVETWYKPLILNILYRDLFIVMILGCLFAVTLPMSLYNVYKAYCSNTLKHSSMYEALLPFFSPMLLFILSTLWVILSPSNILELQPRLFYLMVGTAFSNVTPLTWLLVPMVLVVLLVISGVVQQSEAVLLYVWTAVVILAHIHYGVSVVCTHSLTAQKRYSKEIH
ncbi:Ethanolaminephosphotransferase 1 [Bagarius yarrelli]|uniref:Ethanolaminephosphotransferase 1 n=1 Tax=Bagarius yarrelli TaxID=175774 RepID=A0A556U093_BAGYA|nr:Ethanolaminephosphotransferase 1 [Bagarius yarrelli]